MASSKRSPWLLLCCLLPALLLVIGIVAGRASGSLRQPAWRDPDGAFAARWSNAYGGEKPKRDPDAAHSYVTTSDGEIVEVIDAQPE